MRTFVRFIFLLILLGLIGGGVFLAFWDIPAPTTTIEKPIDDDRLPR
jgi:hypothetical protein